MASQSEPNPTTLELTEQETKLRQLLLDVAAYIDETPASDGAQTEVQVPDELAKEKIVLRWTGGWVRDKLLGVGSHDIDLAINKMTGEHFGLKMRDYLEIPGNAEKHGLVEKSEENAQAGGKAKSRKVAPGLHKIEANPEKSKNLETATTKIMGIDLDLVNLRKETYNEVSRNPQMEFGTPEEDAMRRDATVNAMFFNLHNCQIEDFTGRGFDDMKAKIIRTPLEPYQTFKDDPLRVLRLIRFASRLDYAIDAETEKAMANKDIQEVLKIKISRERVGIELEKMLKGPDPRRALALIHQFGLYETVFTDPTRDMESKPDIEHFGPAYGFVKSVLQAEDNKSLESISRILLDSAERQYLAWICATVMPWADAPLVVGPKGKPFDAAYLVAREGFKAPNKVSDVIALSLKNGGAIRSMVAECYKQIRRGQEREECARETLGMKIREWGATWRTQIFFSLIYEYVRSGEESRQDLLRSYSTFLGRLEKLEILEAYTFDPIVNGKQLAVALKTKPGPWMKGALDVVMQWQLANPGNTDPAPAIEAVKAATNSELPRRLATYFLERTVPNAFQQNKAVSKKAAGEQAEWEKAENAHVITFLEWTISALGPEDINKNIRRLVPPILTLVSAIEIPHKAKGCHLLAMLIHSAPPDTLSRTGYDGVFQDALWPLFTFLPTLTPEPDSVTLLPPAFTALLNLQQKVGGEKMLDRLVRDTVFAPLDHAPFSSYPKLAQVLVGHLELLMEALGIESVKHLKFAVPLLAAVLRDPFVMAYPPLSNAAARALQAVVRNGHPRIGEGGYVRDVVGGVAVAWARCGQVVSGEVEGDKEAVKAVQGELQEVVALVDWVVRCEGRQAQVWQEERREAEKRFPGIEGLFSTCVDAAIEGEGGE
ncbi:tRNA nucleotidyltransferase [Corynespora cassiicola Philippines]|uniref:tRNA nucleotidyltransferase n=1 Tax=Corynespora cassiicola Philippines TaxID=1448308 RepID=A0A2T2N9M4_CORCC|nr:tRNA nucleotidyltransferase [Corynespora cassiicola Philippines]